MQYHAAGEECNLMKCNENVENASKCMSMHLNAYGKKQHHIWGKTTLIPSLRQCIVHCVWCGIVELRTRPYERGAATPCIRVSAGSPHCVEFHEGRLAEARTAAPSQHPGPTRLGCVTLAGRKRTTRQSNGGAWPLLPAQLPRL